MPRRVITDFSKGMVTDTAVDTSSLYTLHDAYVRRPQEVVTRGPIFAEIFASPVSARYCSGVTTACFHPNFGMAAVIGHGSNATEDTPAEADGWHLVAINPTDSNAVTADVPAAISTWTITENGTGSTKDQVCLNAAGSLWLAFEKCQQSITTGSEMIFAGVRGSVFKWGGSHAAPYSTGKVTVSTTGSTLITGTDGASWVTGGALEAGQYILIDNVGEKNMGAGVIHHRAFRITKVHSNTEIEIETPVYLATGNTDLTYRIQSMAVVQSQLGAWNSTTERPTGIGAIGFHDSRLVMFGTSDNETDYNTVFNFDKFRYSGTVDEGGQATGFFTGHDLWPPNAAFEAFAGIGGAARGVASMGSDMILIKAHAMFRVVTSAGLPGVVAGTANLATGSSVSIQIIPGAENVGAKGLNAWGMSKRGLVVASSDGLYVYDGSEVTCVTDNRVARWWEENFSGSSYHVLVYEDKVIVTPDNPVAFDTNNPGAHVSLVWDMERNLFWTMATDCPLSAAVTLYNTQDELTGQIAFTQARGPYDNDQPAGFSVSHMTHTNHQMGLIPQFTDVYYKNANDATITGNYPNASIITPPIPLGEEVHAEGRVNNIIAHFKHSSGSDAGALAGLTLGSVSPDDYLQTVDTMEYELENTDIDQIHRIPVNGTASAPTSRVHIGYTEGGQGRFHLFGIGVDSEQSNVAGA